jgi:hypothetical protein
MLVTLTMCIAARIYRMMDMYDYFQAYCKIVINFSRQCHVISKHATRQLAEKKA